jgi:site-specific DNA recombinase
MTRVAIYGRFSTDRQSDTSIEAQARISRRRADELGAKVVIEHADQAVSGSVPLEHRPGGRALLADALAGRFDVLIVEGLDRLSRDMGEQDRVVKRLEYRGVRILGVSDGYDSQAKSRKVLRVARGLVNELYLDDLRDKVHRSLSAKAARGGHVAGLSYGYRSDARGADRALSIVEDQAAVVREIFERYGAGESCQRIAADLNRRGVRGPRGGTWSIAALYGSPAKGAGILNNRLYVGCYTWNRSQWLKDPDTGKRTRIARPASEWQTDERPELRIVSDVLFEAARARIGRVSRTGKGNLRKGGKPTTLFGGLLRCGKCGGSMIASDAYRYGCTARKDRGSSVCTGTVAPRKATDARLLATVRDELAGPATIAQVRAYAARLLAEHRSDQDTPAARKPALAREISNLVDAIAQVGVSDALRARLAKAEAELAALDRRPPIAALPSVDDVVSIYRRSILNIERALAADIERAREALAQVLGTVKIETTAEGTFAEIAVRADRVLLAAGGSAVGLGCGGRILSPDATVRRVLIR